MPSYSKGEGTYGVVRLRVHGHPVRSRDVSPGAVQSNRHQDPLFVAAPHEGHAIARHGRGHDIGRQSAALPDHFPRFQIVSARTRLVPATMT